jgi:N-acetyl-1-D-myo-inositol-2-amino-2-deoxy-alpha-D-glucopyranoside deacetylase
MRLRNLLLVHAHPDDESIETGATMAKYAAEGARVTLVTCTLGELGEIIPPELQHLTPDELGQYRIGELQRACQALGVTDHRFLGGAGRWRDSGMMGLPDNDDPRCFWQADVTEAARDLVKVIEEADPDVIVSYDANGFYGHPDHIQAHRITVAADRLTAIPAKVYWTGVPRSRMAEFGLRLRELGLFTDEEGQEEGPREEWGTPDEEITTTVDVSAYTDRKYESLECHASQAENIFFLKMGKDVFGQLMGEESYVRAVDRSGAPVPEDDLFAGLQ